jgi:ribosomal protein S18 acetylase RimI-like enzyme
MTLDLTKINYTVRQYQDEDALFISDIDDSIVGTVPNFNVMTLGECQRYKRKHSFFVFQLKNSSVVGYIIFNMYQKKIYQIAVYEPTQRCGIGTILVDKAKQFCEELSLWVDEYNVGAQIFLRENGFLWKETVDGEYRMKWQD